MNWKVQQFSSFHLNPTKQTLNIEKPHPWIFYSHGGISTMMTVNVRTRITSQKNPIPRQSISTIQTWQCPHCHEDQDTSSKVIWSTVTMVHSQTCPHKIHISHQIVNILKSQMQNENKEELLIIWLTYKVFRSTLLTIWVVQFSLSKSLFVQAWPPYLMEKGLLSTLPDLEFDAQILVQTCL